MDPRGYAMKIVNSRHLKNILMCSLYSYGQHNNEPTITAVSTELGMDFITTGKVYLSYKSIDRFRNTDKFWICK